MTSPSGWSCFEGAVRARSCVRSRGAVHFSSSTPWSVGFGAVHSFVWIKHHVACRRGGGCFLGKTQCWYAGKETLLHVRLDESCRLELCTSVVHTGLAGVLWLRKAEEVLLLMLDGF